MRLDLDYTNACIYAKDRCPHLAGVQDHGNRCSIKFDYDMWDKLETKYAIMIFNDAMLNIYADGYINILENKYDYRNEEWYEREVYKFQDDVKPELEADINYMLFNHNIQNRDGLNIDSFDKLMKILSTTKENYIMFSF